jgi:hypothetical protein
MKSRLLLRTLIACVAWSGVIETVSLNHADASQLVVNGGFETGNFSGWSGGVTSYPTDVIVTNSQGYNSLQAVHSGTYSFYFGNSGSTRDLYQVLPTIAGTNYTVSFWLNMYPAVPNELSLSWAGTTIIDQLNFTTNGWAEYVFTELATTDATTLSLPKTRFEHIDGVARQGSDVQQRGQSVQSGACTARPSRAKCEFSRDYNRR